jgi:alkyl hydroperoxide reductase subunit F
VKKIDKPVHLEVMVTLDCQYCPEMVRVAHEFAFVNDHIRADMVEAAEFPDLVKKYQVTGVPRTVINGAHSFVGAMPAGAAYLEIIKVVAPDQYTELTAQLKAARGVDRTKKAEPGHLYELAIVGGGPAAMSAAVYAARKQLDLALIAPKLGGQMNYTAGIENYLGLAEGTGSGMGEAFHDHMARFPVAEAIGETVTKIEKTGAEFALTTDSGKTYNALAVVYCAGKEYKRLGAKGEERLMGKGIAFCATCDAPLYRGKKVAVVGGGNSAFTAVRDLRDMAAEVHLVHRAEDFRADEVLVEEAKKAPNVVFHTSREVREYLGGETLTGLRLESPDGKVKEELPVDGVFLEIGLTPNSAPLKDLLPLTPFGEVAVDKTQATAKKGLFAAGDVTDTEEKQISVAVGQGALAALSAYKYLADNGLTRSKAATKEAWQ